MAKKQYLDLTGLRTLVNEIKTLLIDKANKATTLAGYGITDAASKMHTHDDRYYTESEVNELIANAVAQKSAVQFITWGAND